MRLPNGDDEWLPGKPILQNDVNHRDDFVLPRDGGNHVTKRKKHLRRGFRAGTRKVDALFLVPEIGPSKLEFHQEIK